MVFTSVACLALSMLVGGLQVSINFLGSFPFVSLSLIPPHTQSYLGHFLSFFFLLIFDPRNPQLPLICPTRSSPAALPASPQVIIDWRLLQAPHKQVPWKIQGLRGSWHAS